jgi:hypothetical protein
MREEIGARELHLMEEAVCIEKERIAAPTREESVIASARYKCICPIETGASLRMTSSSSEMPADRVP